MSHSTVKSYPSNKRIFGQIYESFGCHTCQFISQLIQIYFFYILKEYCITSFTRSLEKGWPTLQKLAKGIII